MPITINGTGTISGVSATCISTAQTVTSVGRSALPAGSVIQVVQAVKTDTQSTTSTSYVDVAGMSVTITPTSASNKILVMARVNTIGTSDANGLYINLVRNSTTIVSTTAGGNSDTVDAWGVSGGGGMTNNDRKYANPSLDYLDSPATTSATTYKIQMIVTGGFGTFNRWPLNNDQASVSSITVMEIAA